MTVPAYFFEDLVEGQSWSTARITVTEEAIIGFAFMWDPQPFHLDRMSSEGSIFGGLVASGLHTLMLSYRLYYDHGLLKGTAMAGLGIDEVRFLRPLRAGDTIGVNVSVREKRLASKPDRGIVRIGLQTADQNGSAIFSCVITALVACGSAARGP